MGGYAYVADAVTGLKVIDVRNPARPVVVGQVGAGVEIAVRVVGSRAYMTDLADEKLIILDISNPASPVVFR